MAREAQDAVTQGTQVKLSLVDDAAVSPSLVALGDDPLRHVLTFLSPADGRRGVGTAAKLFRAAASSAALARARGAEGYVLRGTEHGVVHALATACGTKRWPKRAVKQFSDELIDSMSAASDDEDDLTDRRRFFFPFVEPLPSSFSFFFFFSTRLISSCTMSNNTEKNSCASC